MSENNKSYRIRTNVGSEYNGDIKLDVNLLQDFDEFEILSLKIGTENLYKYHTSNYGCVVGRVLANGGVGVPNVKISAFIPVEDIDTNDPIFSFLYPYTSTMDKNRDNIRYNLLTDTKIDDCHQNVGTFPNKRLVLDDNNVIEIYDKYYKFTTTTNGSGDYMLFGLPVGNNIIHSDLDLSDIGILSQKPRDLFYKGYTAKQFENASQFKKDTNLDNLTQVISQDSSVYVFPFWGDETENEGQIKIVRNDIDVNYKFEPTCIFIGCIVSDEKSNAISKNCIPHERMGKMDRLTTGSGTIEMIRKTMSGDIESISIQGNELIDGNGTWCYQIPMNLDYVATDEYGNLVPTDNYEKGLPTRTCVRFRISLADYESDYENAHLVKVLVPNNPQVKTKATDGGSEDYIDYDYEFGSATRDESFRHMFWNNVYTVKSYIPRFQKGNRQRNKNFTGFKAVNVNGGNNPIPYNNMRINLTFLFVFQCLIFKSLVLIVKTLNKILAALDKLGCTTTSCSKNFTCGGDEGPVYLTLDGGMCPTLDGNYIAPGAENYNEHKTVQHTYENVYGKDYTIKPDIVFDGTKTTDSQIVTGGPAVINDKQSADGKNSDNTDFNYYINNGAPEYEVDDISGDTQDADVTETMKIYNQEDYFVKCVELQFAMEYEVIQFDFYNDWINGMIYIPRWFAEIKKNKDKAYYCGDTFTQNRMLTQQCALAYNSSGTIDSKFELGCRKDKQQCHKRWGRKQVKIFGRNKGIVTAQKNSRGQYAYYLRPSEMVDNNLKANLFSTDLILLGSVLDCNQYGIPKVNGYTSSSYKMPPPTAEIISDTQEMIFDNNVKLTEDQKNLLATKQTLSYVNSDVFEYFNTRLSRSITITDKLVKYFQDNKTKCGKEEDFCKLVGRLNNTNVSSYSKCVGKVAPISSLIDLSYDDNDSSFYNDLKITIDDFRESKGIPSSGEKFNETKNEILRKKIGSTIGKIKCEFSIPYKVRKGRSLTTEYESVKKTVGKIYEAYAYYGTDFTEKYNEIKSEYGNQNIIDHFYNFNKMPVFEVQLDGLSETTYSEMSGIDWGYNPFEEGGDKDNTKLIKNQIAGHFLEIGCTFSLSNIKSCVNLQRICEIGSEISQSHYYYYNAGDKWYLLSPTGIIAKREIIDGGIRTTFSTLNSNRLGVMNDSNNGYKKYDFRLYSPVSFIGDLMNRNEISELTTINQSNIYNNYGLIENQSLSYKAFRFGIEDFNKFEKKFLIKNGNMYFMPQYENSFYFYFGLKDGNTAIDRLYSEYYAQCTVNDGKPYVSFIVENAGSGKYNIHYRTENIGSIKTIIMKRNNDPIEAIWDKKRSVITVDSRGSYTITLKDVMGQQIKNHVTC